MACLNHRMMLGSFAAITFLAAVSPEAAAGSLGATEAFARLAAAREVFETNCAICHGYDGAALVEGAPNFAKGERLEKKDAELMKTIRDGKEPMPSWKDVISPAEQKAVLAYVRTIAGSKVFTDNCATCHAEALPALTPGILNRLAAAAKRAVKIGPNEVKRMPGADDLCEKTKADNALIDNDYFAVVGFLTAWGKK